MFKQDAGVKYYQPKITDYVDIFDIEDEHIRDQIHEYGMDNEYSMYNYSDGDYYLLINFNNSDNPWWVDEIKKCLAPAVIERNTFAIWVWH
jgi:hypothetical protein